MAQPIGVAVSVRVMIEFEYEGPGGRGRYRLIRSCVDTVDVDNVRRQAERVDAYRITGEARNRSITLTCSFARWFPTISGRSFLRTATTFRSLCRARSTALIGRAGYIWQLKRLRS